MSDEQAVVPVSGAELQRADEAKERTAIALVMSEKGVQFGTVKEAVAYATACFNSRLLPDQINTPAKAFTIMAAGAELGLKPFASWRGLYLTKAGRIAVMTKTALGKVRSSGLLEDYEEKIEFEGDLEKMRAAVRAQRKGQRTPIIETFSIEDAKAAGLLDKKTNREGRAYDSTYDKYLKDMLRSRARGRALDTGFSDVLSGILPEGIAEDADAAEQERRGATPAEAKRVDPAQGDPLADRLRATAPRPGPGDGATSPEALDDSEAPSARNNPNAWDQGVAAGETASSIAQSVDDALDGEPPVATRSYVPDTGPESKPLSVKAVKAADPCPRCKTKLNEMLGCDNCGWPGKDLR